MPPRNATHVTILDHLGYRHLIITGGPAGAIVWLDGRQMFESVNMETALRQLRDHAQVWVH